MNMLKSALLDQGIVDIWIDEVVPCLRNTSTNILVDTEVFQITNKNSLKEYNEASGWHISWDKIPAGVDVFGLSLKGETKIQGLLAIKNDIPANAVYIHWACTAPHNNKFEFGYQKYAGVGGHLFAIAVDKSIQWGHDGYVYGYAANRALLNHYMKRFSASFIGMLHAYHFALEENVAKKLLEVYRYDWRVANS